MKRVADFIVEKRFIILIVAFALAAVSAMLIPLVEINTDMTKYLPDDSSMKMGIDVMEEEFPDMEESYTIRVMFTGLPEDRKEAVEEELAALAYVDDVTYKAGDEDYNKADHTLYVVSTLYDFNTPESLALEAALKERFADQDMVFVRDNDSVSEELPAPLIAFAIGILMVILFIMCASWLEPILFLTTIGVAVVINMGSNLLLGTVSDTTSSIASILQLVLSMDYSIILINRYRQELEQTPDKLAAMKAALHGAFGSIASSAVTTIVGLLVLVFMNFKIGKDLGVVLAKGVFLSMVSVFTLLPSLILLCDKWIQKTAKKVPHVKMNAISAFSYKFRHVITVAFVFLFFGSYFLQGTTETAFTLDTVDPIADVFPATNTVLVLFDNDDEREITQIAEHLEENEHVKSVASISTTIGKPYTSAELADELEDMEADSDVDLDASVLDILYYYKYKNGETGEIATGDFLRFIADDVAENKTFADRLDDEIRDNLDMLSTFADKDELTASKTIAELADLFEMDEDDLASLLVFYYGKRGGMPAGTMTLPEFVRFIQSDILTDEDFSDLLDEDTLDMMELLETITDRKELQARKAAADVADTLDMDMDDVELLYLYYFGKNGAADNLELTFPAFADLLVNKILTDDRFADALDDDIRKNADKITIFADQKRFQVAQTTGETASALDMEEDMAELLYAFYFAEQGAVDGKALKIPQFISVLEDILDDDRFDSSFDAESRDQIDILRTFGNKQKFQAKYSSRGVADLLDIDPALADMLFAFYYASKGEISGGSMTVGEFIRFLQEDIVNNRALSAMMSDNADLSQISMLSAFTDEKALLEPQTSAQLAKQLGGMGIEQSMVDMVFALHYSGGAQTMTLPAFIDFLMAQSQNPSLSGMIDPSTLSQLGGLQAMIAAASSGGFYSAGELAAFTGMSAEMVEQILTASGTTAMELLDFLDLVTTNFGGMIPPQDMAKLTATSQMLGAAASGASFSAGELASFFGLEEAAVKLLFTMSGGASGGVGLTMTLSDFIDTLADDFGSLLGGAADSVNLLKELKDAALSGRALSAGEMAALLGMDDDMISAMYYISQNSKTSSADVVLYDLVEFIVQDLSDFGGSELGQLAVMKEFMDSVLAEKSYTAAQMSELVGGMEPDLLKILYAYHETRHGDTESWKVSLQTLVEFVMTDLVGGEFGDSLNQEDRDGLEMARTLMNGTVSGHRYTAAGLANLLDQDDLDPAMLKVLYAYHIHLYGDTSGWLLNLQELVDFILGDLAVDENFGDTFDKETLDDLEMLRKIMAGTMAGTAYQAEALADLLDMDAEMPRQLYLLRISRYGDTSGWSLPVRTFIHFIHDDVLTDEDLADRIDGENIDLLDGARRIVDSVIAGDACTATEMAALFDGLSDDLSASQIELLYVYYFSRIDSDPAWTFSLYDLFNYLLEDVLPDPLFADVFDSETRQTLLDSKEDLDEAIEQLAGPNYSRMVISSTYPGESDETYAFIGNLLQEFDGNLGGNYYLIGGSPMNYEMAGTFDGEMAFITALTAIAIFIVIMLTFRSLSIPLILVLIIQCGVYITISLIGLQGYSIYYLALLIVQCILMGATIDYGILFTSYYLEKRRELPRQEALTEAYNGSIHTILTSGSIMILVTGILGFLFENPTIGEICMTISRGAMSATFLIVFVLPGILAVFDRWICGKPKKDAADAAK